MRHLKSGRKLNRTASHRKSMLANLATSILDKERVTTTVPKAKEVRGVVERQITYAKTGTLHAVRLAAKTIRDKTVLKKLFDEIAPGYKNREGGYLRIIKKGDRCGDNAPMCIVELVGRDDSDISHRPKRKSVSSKKTAVKELPKEAAIAAEVSKEVIPSKSDTESGATDAGLGAQAEQDVQEES